MNQKLTVMVESGEIKPPTSWKLITKKEETPCTENGEAFAYYFRLNVDKYVSVFTERMDCGSTSFFTTAYNKQEWEEQIAPRLLHD